MLDIGRTESPEQQLQKVYKQIENAQKGIGRGGRAAFGLGISQPSLDALYKRAADLQAKIAADGAKNLEQATNNAIQAAGKKGIDLINSTYKSSLTQIQRLQQEMDALDKGRLAAQKAGALSAEEEAKFAKGRKNIEQQIADIKEREAKKSAPKARGQNVGVREADNTASRLLAQYDPAGQAVRTLTKEETQLQLALSRGKITREEYSKALAQASLNYAAQSRAPKASPQPSSTRRRWSGNSRFSASSTLPKPRRSVWAARRPNGTSSVSNWSSRPTTESSSCGPSWPRRPPRSSDRSFRHRST